MNKTVNPKKNQTTLLDGFVSEKEIARMLRRSVNTLQAWRARGVGPPYTMSGRSPLYDVARVRQWLADGGTAQAKKEAS